MALFLVDTAVSNALTQDEGQTSWLDASIWNFSAVWFAPTSLESSC
ncbi:MAG: hypothetical protein KDD89_07610 [Anaerolineales bacterium]|nr:hypothetical protein [Anaerolineales bacterium]